jgi:hypothetical protein
MSKIFGQCSPYSFSPMFVHCFGRILLTECRLIPFFFRWLHNFVRIIYILLVIIFYHFLSEVLFGISNVEHWSVFCKRILLGIRIIYTHPLRSPPRSFKFIQDKVAIGQLHVIHVPTNLQFTGIMTKCPPREVFEDFRSSLCVLPGAAQTAGV